MTDRQVARLKAALADRDERVRILEARVAALEASASFRIGQAFTGAARSPARGVVRLPRELYRVWRSGGATSVVTSTDARPRPMHSARDEDRLIAGSTPGLAVAGVFGPRMAEALGGLTRLVPLLPHDAEMVLDIADVDLVIVDAAAGEPGMPWAYLGVPGVPDRERALLGLVHVARDRGRPVVLAGSAPALNRIGWDAVIPPEPPTAEELTALCARLGIEES